VNLRLAHIFRKIFDVIVGVLAALVMLSHEVIEVVKRVSGVNFKVGDRAYRSGAYGRDAAAMGIGHATPVACFNKHIKLHPLQRYIDSRILRSVMVSSSM
jgi:hypothetical protein